MTTQNPVEDQQDAEFAEAFRRSEPKRCMFDLEGPCSNVPVEGHFIQEGLLKLIQDSKKRVISFYNFRPRNVEELNVDYTLNRPMPPGEAAKVQFLCNEHERFFWLVENPGPEWDDFEHKARLAYRTCLINRYFKEWVIELAHHLPHLAGVLVSQRQQLSYASPLESAIREYLNGDNLCQLRHTVARIGGKPIIAASGLILHPQLGTFFYDSRNNRVIPTQSFPIVITVLPAKSEQVIMFSYSLDGMLSAKHLLDALEYHNGSLSTARLSKKLLEEIEFIHISPNGWASLGRHKQDFIMRYWKDAFGVSESELNISPSQVDLFAPQDRSS